MLCVWFCNTFLGQQKHKGTCREVGVWALFGAPQREQHTPMNGRYCILENSRTATNSRKFFPFITAKQNRKRSNLESWERRWWTEPMRGQGQAVCVHRHTHTHAHALVGPGEMHKQEVLIGSQHMIHLSWQVYKGSWPQRPHTEHFLSLHLLL